MGYNIVLGIFIALAVVFCVLYFFESQRFTIYRKETTNLLKKNELMLNDILKQIIISEKEIAAKNENLQAKLEVQQAVIEKKQEKILDLEKALNNGLSAESKQKFEEIDFAMLKIEKLQRLFALEIISKEEYEMVKNNVLKKFNS